MLYIQKSTLTQNGTASPGRDVSTVEREANPKLSFVQFKNVIEIKVKALMEKGLEY